MCALYAHARSMLGQFSFIWWRRLCKQGPYEILNSTLLARKATPYPEVAEAGIIFYCLRIACDAHLPPNLLTQHEQP